MNACSSWSIPVPQFDMGKARSTKTEVFDNPSIVTTTVRIDRSCETIRIAPSLQLWTRASNTEPDHQISLERMLITRPRMAVTYRNEMTAWKRVILPHRSIAHGHIRGLIAHGDREGVVEKIPVIWGLIVGKTQPFPDGKRGIALVHVVIPMGVIERVEYMKENPGQHDRQQGGNRVDILVERGPVLGDVGHETHAGHAETREDHSRYDDESVTRLPILVIVLDIVCRDPVDPSKRAEPGTWQRQRRKRARSAGLFLTGRSPDRPRSRSTRR